MPEVTQHAPGTFCWFELGTTDDAAAVRFYTGLFGWATSVVPMGPDAVYTLFQAGGRDVGAAYRLMPQQTEAGVPPHWLHYVAVSDAAAACERAKALGGNVVLGPLEVYDLGRMGVIQDPAGAMFGVWQAVSHIGVGRAGEPGTHCWSELATRDPAGAGAFYGGLFGWTPQAVPMGPTTYTLFRREGGDAGGMMAMDAQWGDIPPHWMIYFAVDDCDATVERAQALGARLVLPPTRAEGVGRFAILMDPQGAGFSVIRMDARG